MSIIQPKMADLYQKYIEFDQKWSKTTEFLINFNTFD